LRAIIQRVSRASVTVSERLVGRCGHGFLLLVGAHKDDTDANVKKLAEKVANLRVFNDEQGKMNISLSDLPPQNEAQVLAVSNFTVYGDASGQRRPSFVQAAPYEDGERLFHAFVDHLRHLGVTTETGEFGSHMEVELLNDGPVTLILDV
jgi:D-tyrosyl-tRNA(Tyr) deacylase